MKIRQTIDLNHKNEIFILNITKIASSSSSSSFRQDFIAKLLVKSLLTRFLLCHVQESKGDLGSGGRTTALRHRPKGHPSQCRNSSSIDPALISFNSVEPSVEQQEKQLFTEKNASLSSSSSSSYPPQSPSSSPSVFLMGVMCTRPVVGDIAQASFPEKRNSLGLDLAFIARLWISSIINWEMRERERERRTWWLISFDEFKMNNDRTCLWSRSLSRLSSTELMVEGVLRQEPWHWAQAFLMSFGRDLEWLEGSLDFSSSGKKDMINRNKCTKGDHRESIWRICCGASSSSI